MSVKLLDPTLDVVFKLLLLRDQSLLRDMIESVVNLRVPIAELEVQNPEIQEDAPGDKSVVSGEVLSPVFELHVLELPKLQLATADRQAKLERWARFLRATTVEELQELAQEDPIMNTAKKVLEDLSLDPEARRIARDRETAVLMHRHLMAASREEGRAEGEAKGLVLAIRSLCSVLGIALDDAKETQLARLDRDRLLEVLRTLETERRWPADE